MEFEMQGGRKASNIQDPNYEYDIGSKYWNGRCSIVHSNPEDFEGDTGFEPFPF